MSQALRLEKPVYRLAILWLPQWLTLYIVHACIYINHYTNLIIILILHLSVRDVRDVRESGRSREAIRPELKTFVSLHSWTWTLHEAAH